MWDLIGDILFNLTAVNLAPRSKMPAKPAGPPPVELPLIIIAAVFVPICAAVTWIAVGLGLKIVAGALTIGMALIAIFGFRAFIRQRRNRLRGFPIEPRPPEPPAK